MDKNGQSSTNNSATSVKGQTKPLENILYLKINSPERIFFEGEAEALSSVNEKGKFDVLPQHANFISIIKEVLVISEKGGGKQEIKIDSGVLKAHSNTLNIFLGIETVEELTQDLKDGEITTNEKIEKKA